jgi:hypothetical protein
MRPIRLIRLMWLTKALWPTRPLLSSPIFDNVAVYKGRGKINHCLFVPDNFIICICHLLINKCIAIVIFKLLIATKSLTKYCAIVLNNKGYFGIAGHSNHLLNSLRVQDWFQNLTINWDVDAFDLLKPLYSCVNIWMALHFLFLLRADASIN